MSKNIDDTFDDSETVKSFRFWTYRLNKPFTPKFSPYKTLSKFEPINFSQSGSSSVRH
jgi:hypothetical protein